MQGKGKSFYRIVVMENKKKLSAPALDTLGTWQPSKDKLTLDSKKVNDWKKKGATVSSAVLALISK